MRLKEDVQEDNPNYCKKALKFAKSQKKASHLTVSNNVFKNYLIYSLLIGEDSIGTKKIIDHLKFP